MNRRLAAFGAAGAAACAGGAALSIWRGQVPSLDALWRLNVYQPDGQAMNFSALRGKPLILNFWATWCAPCVRELPAIDRFYREFAAKGWQVVAMAVDSPGPVVSFLGKVKISMPVALVGAAGLDVARDLGNSSGSLPYTALINAGGKVAQTRLGETSFDELAQWANKR